MDTNALIQIYEAHVAGLEDNEHLDEEVMLTLNDRDAIEDRWPALGSADRARVRSIDKVLRAKFAFVAKTLAGVEPVRSGRWWWSAESMEEAAA